jgi:hypothetical protein
MVQSRLLARAKILNPLWFIHGVSFSSSTVSLVETSAHASSPASAIPVLSSATGTAAVCSLRCQAPSQDTCRVQTVFNPYATDKFYFCGSCSITSVNPRSYSVPQKKRVNQMHLPAIQTLRGDDRLIPDKFLRRPFVSLRVFDNQSTASFYTQQSNVFQMCTTIRTLSPTTNGYCTALTTAGISASRTSSPLSWQKENNATTI